jgi:hypothetical protein
MNPIPFRQSDSESILASYSLTLLVVGKLLCRGSFKPAEPICYVTYNGVESTPPTTVINNDLDKIIAASDEPLIFLLDVSSQLGTSILSLVNKLEVSKDIAITSTPD